MTNSPLRFALILTIPLLLGACSNAVRWDSAPAAPSSLDPGDSAVSAPSSVATAVVNTANRQVGAPYRYGGTTPRGFDCSGLVYYAYRNAGLRVPRTTTALYRTANPITLDELQLGDILFFYFDNKVGHVAIYTGGTRFVHAPSSGKYVMRGSLDNQFWRERLVSAGRLF